MTHRPLFFLTNDDGIQSPGLRAAARAVLALGDVLVVAPARQQTAMGRSLTGRPDACLERVDFQVDGQAVEAYACDGSPAAVVRHALSILCRERHPDLLVSGINYGENLGIGISASGTVGAALEAAGQGIPALAVSQQMHPDHFLRHEAQDWSASEHFLRHFAQKMVGMRLPKDVDLLKLDVPEYATLATPWRLTRLSRQGYFHMVLDDPGLHSRLRDGRITVQVDQATLEVDSDVYALACDHVVSVTPISLDATSRTDFGTLRASLEDPTS